MLFQFKGNLQMFLRSSVYRAELCTDTDEHIKLWYQDNGSIRIEFWAIGYSDCIIVNIKDWRELAKHIDRQYLKSDNWTFYAYYPY